MQKVKPIVKGGRFLQIKATYYNPISKKKIKLVIKDSYKLIPMPLRDFGKCFNLDCHKEVMPYSVYTYENVRKGYCKVDDALSILKDGENNNF